MYYPKTNSDDILKMYVVRGPHRASKKMIPPIRNLTRDLIRKTQFKFQTEAENLHNSILTTSQGVHQDEANTVGNDDTIATKETTLETIKSGTEDSKIKPNNKNKILLAKGIYAAKKGASSIKKQEITTKSTNCLRHCNLNKLKKMKPVGMNVDIETAGREQSSNSIETTLNADGCSENNALFHETNKFLNQQTKKSSNIRQVSTNQAKSDEGCYPNKVPTPQFVQKYSKKPSQDIRDKITKTSEPNKTTRRLRSRN